MKQEEVTNPRKVRFTKFFTNDIDETLLETMIISPKPVSRCFEKTKLTTAKLMTS